MSIYELRTYTLYVGKMAEAVAVYQEHPWYDKYSDKLVGYFQSDIGALNQLVHLWKYEDDADRRHDLMSNAEMRPESLNDYLLHQLAELDIDDRVDAAHLVEVDLLGRPAVEVPFGLGEEAEGGDGAVPHAVRQPGLLHQTGYVRSGAHDR